MTGEAEDSIPPKKNVKEFFELSPPGVSVQISGLAEPVSGMHRVSYRFLLPPLELYCRHESCQGIRFFDSDKELWLEKNDMRQHFVNYTCRNCGETRKAYAVLALLAPDGDGGELYKLGEIPQFGPHTPAKVISLAGKERDYYLKGRKAETQGLGIAAFAYYRRVIENQKDRIFDEIIKVSEKIGADRDLISDLEKAKKETQFAKAVAQVKHGIPQALLISGHNPLTLLHSALSEGLHAQTDEECLQLAQSIRIVLSDFVERVANTLKDTAELNSAVSRLLNSKAKNGG